MPEQIPLMYQAQVGGRSQIQRLIPGQPRQQAYDWVEEWIEGCDENNIPKFGQHVETRSYAFSWRMVTNSGQDDGVIRPVIGERGWAYFPGSSMKGTFLRACRRLHPEKVLDYCGGEDSAKNLHPGLLRFHGGYADSPKWLNRSLVDVVHPQEDWQVKGQDSHSALIQISLYKPKFAFGMSSTKPLTSEQWEQVWEIWESALGRGIGSRVSAGYGLTNNQRDSRLLSVGLVGQGLCSQRIDKVGEFRPNGFKAALRAQTRRLLSGVADEATVTKVLRQLWGGFAGREGAVVGLLGVACSAPNLEPDIYRYSKNEMPVYETDDLALNIFLMKDISEDEKKALGRFVTQLIKFSLLLGGFGKSWRRADHRLFLPEYLKNNNKPMIGCHWGFAERSHRYYIPVGSRLSNVTLFLDKLQENLAAFPLLKKAAPGQPTQGSLREAWQKGNVEVWGRIAANHGDSQAIRWFHGAYKGEQSIYRSELTGQMGQIGRIWHRMYPRYRKQENETVSAGGFVELLTIFPNREGNGAQVEKTSNFLDFLRESSDFEQLW